MKSGIRMSILVNIMSIYMTMANTYTIFACMLVQNTFSK